MIYTYIHTHKPLQNLEHSKITIFNGKKDPASFMGNDNF